MEKRFFFFLNVMISCIMHLFFAFRLAQVCALWSESGEPETILVIQDFLKTD